MRAALVACAAAAFAAGALAQGTLPGADERALEADGLEIRYRVHTPAANAHLDDPARPLEPKSALDTSKLLHRALVAGDIESAAILSNAPRERFVILRNYRDEVGEAEFRRVFAEYFEPANRVVAEISIGRHRMLVWSLRHARHLAAQYYVEIGGRTFVDDVPSEDRIRLRRVLESYRHAARESDAARAAAPETRPSAGTD